MPAAQEAQKPPRETTRLRLEHPGDGLVAHLSAMTVAHGGMELYHEKVRAVWQPRMVWTQRRIPERLVLRMSSSKRALHSSSRPPFT
jgi:hypothetical protein